jgi:hypothetical protein
VAKYRKETKSKLIVTVGTIAASIIASLLTVVAPTQAASSDISLYLSAPFVQGSHVTGADVTFENFNNFTLGTCPASIQGASVTGCRIDAPAGHGGATADADNPNPVLGYHPSSNPTDTAANRAGSDFITTYDSGGSVFPPITLTLSRSVKYVGFWWSAGSTGNTVEFFNGNTKIQTLTSVNITTLLGTKTGKTITDVVNRTKNSADYFGHPKNRTLTDSQPFTYLNLFLSGVTADKIVFTGAGFEFDNFVTSTQEWGPTADMIFVSSSTGSTPVVSPQVVAWSPTNTSVPVDSAPLTPSAPAAVITPASDGGPITYSVVDPGTTGCTVDPSTGVITRPAAGTCVVRATAAPVTSPTRLFSSFVDVSFSISAASPPPSSGSSPGTTTAPPVQVVKADPCTAVASTRSVTRKAKNFPGFAINSARITPAMKRQITNWLNSHPKEVCVSVAGFTMGPRVLPTDPKLARDRARAVRAYIKSIRPEASFTPITSRTQRLVGDDIRRAKVTLRF